MDFKIYFFFSFFLLFYIADAFNITQLLSKYPDYSTFNSYLTQTHLAGDINSRKTITVLAVSNDNISPLSGRSGDVLKSIMSVHVVLDYYDIKKLQNIPNKTTILTTLFQSSGKARGQQGFLNVTDSGSDVKIGSAVKGATEGTNLVGSVASQPYNISVLQISSIIVPVGLDNTTNSPPLPSPGPANSPTPAKSPSPGKSPKSPPSPSPSPSPSNASSPDADSSDAVAPGASPDADSPGASPDADSPGASPGASPDANAPAADAPADHSPSSGLGPRLSLEAVLIIVSSAVCLPMV